MKQWAAILGLRLRLLARTGGSRGMGSLLVPLSMMSLVALWIWAALSRYLSTADASTAAGTAHLVLAALWTLWATSPLLGHPFSDFHDVAKLLPYPISHGRAFLASTVAGMVGFSALPLVAIVAAFVVRLPGSPAVQAARVLVALALFLHTAILSHGLHLFVLSLFGRRRLRDLAMLLAPFFSLGLYLLFRALVTRRPGEPGPLPAGPIPWLWALPPRWISGAFVDPAAASAEVLGGLAAFVLATLGLARFGARVQARAFYAEILDERRIRTGERGPATRALRLVAPLGRLLPAPTRAVAAKEWILLWRDPILANQLARQTMIVVLPFLFPLLPSSEAAATEGLLATVVAFLFFSQAPILTNVFGTDGSAVRELLLRGQDRRHVFLGKNLCHLALFLPIDAIVLAAFVAFHGRADGFGSYFLATLLMTVFHVGFGNVVSVYLPYPIARGRAGRAIEQQPERPEGCGRNLVRMLAGVAALLAAAPIPILVALGAAYAGWPGPVLAAAYAAGGWILSILVAASLLSTREEELLAAMR